MLLLQVKDSIVQRDVLNETTDSTLRIYIRDRCFLAFPSLPRACPWPDAEDRFLCVPSQQRQIHDDVGTLTGSLLVDQHVSA